MHVCGYSQSKYYGHVIFLQWFNILQIIILSPICGKVCINFATIPPGSYNKNNGNLMCVQLEGQWIFASKTWAKPKLILKEMW